MQIRYTCSIGEKHRNGKLLALLLYEKRFFAQKTCRYQTIRISELMPRDSVALRKKCKDGIVVRSRCDNYSSQALLTLRLLDAIVMVVMMAPVVAASFRNTPVTLV